jgi:DNA-directed RNA polymerase beta subunit
MTPTDARQRNFTYSSNLTVDIIITAKTLGDDNEYAIDTKQLNGVLLGKIPIMVKSNYCILNNKVALINGHECKYDYGGYFLINGNEKVIISQDRISENKTYVFVNNKVSTYSHIAEIRSVQENKLGVPKITSLKLSAKGNQFGRFIRVNIHHIKNDIPIFILFKALGLTNDKDIIKYIVYDLDDQLNTVLINELIGSIEEANNIQCPKDALEYLSKYLNITGYPKEILNNKIHRINIVRNVLSTEFLPHVGREFHKKALYLGYMVNKLLKCFLQLKEFDDRDSYINKKVDTPGVLMANLFRQYYGKVVKDMKNMIQKEINVGGWRATNKFINVINKVNIYKIVKSTIIDSGMRYALATGNWGIKNNKNKQGVAQVLNRMTYSATISHMRRVNTPIEKSGKLVQPRKLHSTQWGIICPSECFDPATPILLWDGIIKRAAEIVVGDNLIDDNGNPVRVRTTCSGIKTMYDVIPEKNNFMKYTVTDNHILTLKVKNHKQSRTNKEFMWFDKKELKYKYKDFNNTTELELFKSTIDDDNVIDITIEKYLSLPENVQKDLYIFKSDGINWEYKEVALDPYILGMWLGEGLLCGYGFVTADQELLDKWIEWGDNNDAIIKQIRKYKYKISSKSNTTEKDDPLRKLLDKYNLVNNKHIPLDYVVNDRKTRLALLAGLIDTDGNINISTNEYEIRIPQEENNYQIIYDTGNLARSLGFSCHIIEGMYSYTVNGEEKHKPYKELSITGQYLYEIPTVLPRKKINKFENSTSEQLQLQSLFTLVKKDIQPFVGWQLEGNGRFLLADAQVAHNTPEGASVGLVKNMSMICSITISSNSINVREIIHESGADIFDGTNIEMFHKNTKIIVNGDIIGIHRDPYNFFRKLKADKLLGTINIYTSIVWNIKENEITISTEGGRCVRPLYLVDEDTTNIKLTREIVEGIKHGKIGWKDILVNYGVVEFVDVEESNTSMIAMRYADLLKGQKGSLLPIKYTHLEIHPSLILGVLASTIPFSDHNQSPRNCFPTEDHEVLTIHGFLGLDEILEYTADGKELAVACHVDGRLEYHKIGRDRVVYQDDEGKPLTATEFVSFKSKNSDMDISLLATTNHNMYGRLGFVDESYSWSSQTTPPDYKTYEAGEIIKFAEQESKDNIPVFQLQCNFKKDIASSEFLENLQFAKSLGLVVDDQIEGLQYGNKKDGIIHITSSKLRDKVEHLCILAGYSVITRKGNEENTWDVVYTTDSTPFLKIGEDIESVKMKDPVPIFCVAVPTESHLIMVRRKASRPTIVGNTYQSLEIHTSVLMGDYSKKMIKDIKVGEEVITFHPETKELSISKVINQYVKPTDNPIMEIITSSGRKITATDNHHFMTNEGWKEVKDFDLSTTKLAILDKIPIYEEIYKITEVANCLISDITTESENHSFIAADGFMVHNSAQCKQAIGVYALNYRDRYDTLGHVMHYPQRPIVKTKMASILNTDNMPNGTNAIVAIACYTG